MSLLYAKLCQSVTSMARKSVDKVLRRIYYDPSHPAAYSSVNALYKSSKEYGIKRKEIESWLKKQDVYTLHKPARRKFKRNKVVVFGINSQWQADLVDLASLQKWNKKFKYLLTCIDVFSKYAYVVPIKSKSGEALIGAFKKIVKDGQKPIALQTDKGTEFINRQLQKWLKTQNIRYFTSNNETKCSVIERFNRTLKTKMWKHFTAKNTLKYIDVLPSLVKGYNNAYHRSIGRAPTTVNINNQMVVKQRLYPNQTSSKNVRFKFDIGSKVRISKNKLTFEKGYRPNWTGEVFEIAERIKRTPPVYRIKDFGGEMVEGTFYEAELQEVTKTDDDLYQVDKVLKRRKRNGKTEYFVSWKNYPSKFDSWVSDIQVGTI